MSEHHHSYKKRNTLDLTQRVQIIREYDLQNPKPKIQMLGLKYDVSFAQIRKILLNRDSILKSYQDLEEDDDIYDELQEENLRKRQEKIEFLGRVMYEYIQRLLYLELSTDDEQFLMKATEVQESIKVDNFRPSLSWLMAFKQMYGIPSFDLMTLRSSIKLTELKRRRLATIDLIAYMSSLEEKMEYYDQSCEREAKQKEECGEIPTAAIPSPPPLYYNKRPKIDNTQRTEGKTGKISHIRSSDDYHIQNGLQEEFLLKRREKIEFLNQVMYEFLQRVLYHKLSIDDKQLLQKAIEVQEHIAVENFQPTFSWLFNFKRIYGILSFDLKTLCNSITLTEPKQLQLSAIDLILYVSSLEKVTVSTKAQGCESETKEKVESRETKSSSPPPLYYTERPVIVYTRRNEDITSVKSFNYEKTADNVEVNEKLKVNGCECQHHSMEEITSLSDAVRHLRLLEEYAMLQENYRAIGLLTQLENVFKEFSKSN